MSETQTPEPTPASDVHPDVLELAQKIVDKVNELVSGVESLDANNWLTAADEIDSLNNQLQSLLLPPQEKKTTSKKS